MRLLILLAFFVMSASAPIFSKVPGHSGFLKLRSAPFPHPNRRYYRDNRAAYFYPNSFDSGQPFQIVVYLHGWNNSIDRVLAQEQLPDQIVASRRNAVLIIPALAKNAQDSFGGKLEAPSGFSAMVDEIRGKLKWKSEGELIVVAHSGGYVPLLSILKHGGKKIRAVILLDGLYSQHEVFLEWKQRHPESKLFIFYTNNGKTVQEIAQLKTTLEHFRLKDACVEIPVESLPSLNASCRIVLVNLEDVRHDDVPSQGYLESLLPLIGDS